MKATVKQAPRGNGLIAPCVYDPIFQLTAAKPAFHVSQT
jgi:hypothetical protein